MPKNKETLQETSADENPVIASKFGQLCTSGNVEIVDGMQGVRGSNPLTSTRCQIHNIVPSGKHSYSSLRSLRQMSTFEPSDVQRCSRDFPGAGYGSAHQRHDWDIRWPACLDAVASGLHEPFGH